MSELWICGCGQTRPLNAHGRSECCDSDAVMPQANLAAGPQVLKWPIKATRKRKSKKVREVEQLTKMYAGANR